jgi:hypothetical protein
MSPDLSRVTWRKSRYSGGNNGQCVEVGHLRPEVAIRDSKNPEGGALVVGEGSWARFLATASRDGFRRA